MLSGGHYCRVRLAEGIALCVENFISGLLSIGLEAALWLL